MTTLADDVIAQVGGKLDAEHGGVYKSLAKALHHAERFVLDNDVANAAYALIDSRPTSVAAALPLCRAPYPTTWLEWFGIPKHIVLQSAPPAKCGCLIETDSAGMRGYATYIWQDRKDRTVDVSGMGWAFDYSGSSAARWLEGQVDARGYPGGADRWKHLIDRKLYSRGDATIAASMSDAGGRWRQLAEDPAERAAVAQLEGTWVIYPSYHAATHVDWLMQPSRHDLGTKTVEYWFTLIDNAPPAIATFLLLLNSKNGTEQELTDLSRLNRSRLKSGKRPLLDHRVTRLRLTAARLRDAEASGMTHAEMRAHLVRGHFKVRRTGVYWWSAFVRGHHGTVERDRYEVRA